MAKRKTVAELDVEVQALRERVMLLEDRLQDVIDYVAGLTGWTG